MNRPCVWLCTLTAATAAAVSDARAFHPHGSGGFRFAHVVGGPELHAPTPAMGKSASTPSGDYSFSGNSFNLSVTRNGRPPPPATSSSSAAPSPERPGFFQRLFNWW